MPQFSLYDDKPTTSVTPSRPTGRGFSLYGPEKEETQEEASAKVPSSKSNGLLETVTTPLSKTLDVITRPGAATAGAVGAALQGENPIPRAVANLTGARRDSFGDVLGEQGMPEGKTRDILGFAADVVIDPLNIGAVAALPFKALKAAGRLRPIAKGLEAAKSAPLVEDLGKKFIPYYGLDKFKEAAPAAGREAMTYADKRRLLASGVEATHDDAAKRSIELFDGITPDEAREIAFALDKGTPLADQRLEGLRLQTKKAFDDQWAKEAAAGIMPKERKVDNYVTYLLKRGGPDGKVRALSGKNRFSLERELKTLEQAEKAGAEVDIRKIFAHRVGGGNKALKVNDFFLDAAKQFGSAKAFAGSRTVKLAGEVPMKNAVKGVHFPAAIADDLEKMVQLGSEKSPLGQIFSHATALWKGYATRINPGFHLRNHISNMANSWIGGMGVDTMAQRYVEAAKWDSAPHAIGKFSEDQIENALKEYGVVGGHHTAFQELDTIIEDQMKSATMSKGRKALDAINPASRTNIALKGGARVGNAVETWSRKALFFDQLHKGKSLEDAALHVRKYLFDYSELTDTEKAIRDYGIPFYTWMRKNVPLQIEAVIKQPQKVAVFGKAFNSLEQASEEEGIQVPKEARPDYMNETGYVQLPTKTDTGASVLVNPSLPIQDLNRVPTSDVKGTLQKDVVANLNPLLRVGLELAMNKEAFTDRPIYNPMTGPTGLKRANALSEGVRQLSDKTGLPVADMLGIVTTNRGTEMPAIADYAMRQIPATTTLGRVVETGDVESGGGIEAFGGVPSNLATMVGVSNKTLTPAQLKATIKQKKKDARAKKTAKRREKTRQRKSETSLLYAEWLSGADN